MSRMKEASVGINSQTKPHKCVCNSDFESCLLAPNGIMFSLLFLWVSKLQGSSPVKMCKMKEFNRSDETGNFYCCICGKFPGSQQILSRRL